jgi:hypothetical protein
VGEAGSGKSKAVAKICIDRYRSILSRLTRSQAPTERLGIPVFLPARRLDQIESSDALLDEVLPIELRHRFTIDILIIDGLDEVGGGERDNVLARAESFSDDCGAALLITSRKIAAVSSARENFEGFELLPFEIGQAVQLFQKVLTDIQALPALRDGVQRAKAQLPMNPLSLLLLVELVTERKEVPSSVTELYDRFLDLVFGRWDQEKGVEVLFEYVVKKRFLASLAYREFYEKDRLEIPRAAFERFLMEYAKLYRWDDAKLRAFLREVERAGVLQLHDEVFFRHRSFLDYFVGLYVFDNRTSFAALSGVVASLYHDPVWAEVAFFFVGLGREITDEQLNTILLYEGERNHPIDKLLAGRLLQAGWHSPTTVKETGVRRILNYVDDASNAAEAFLKKVEADSPLLHSDLITLLLIDDSLGSIFVSQESADVLRELEASDGKSRGELLRRLSLLWALRRHLPSEQHTQHLKRFAKSVQSADFDAISEARMLLLAAVADPVDGEIQKAIGRRLRRLMKLAPGALDPLLPPSKRPKRIPKPRKG